MSRMTRVSFSSQSCWKMQKLLASRTSTFVDDAFKFGFEVCRWRSGRAVSVRLAALSPHDRHDQGDEEGEKCDEIFQREHGVYRRGQRRDLDSCRLQGASAIYLWRSVSRHTEVRLK